MKRIMAIEDENLGLERNPNAGGGISYQCDVFDRPTVLSMGPDGLPGDTTTRSTGQTRIFGTGDDITRSF